MRTFPLRLRVVEIAEWYEKIWSDRHLAECQLLLQQLIVDYMEYNVRLSL